MVGIVFEFCVSLRFFEFKQVEFFTCHFFIYMQIPMQGNFSRIGEGLDFGCVLFCSPLSMPLALDFLCLVSYFCHLRFEDFFYLFLS